jgi:hypothetical protein
MALAQSYHGLAIALAELKRETLAETAFRRGLDHFQKLSADFPQVLEYRQDLATGYTHLSDFLASQGKHAARVSLSATVMHRQKRPAAV